MIIKNGAFLIKGTIFLISGVSEGFETNENGVAQEVHGTFVKSYKRSGKWKNVCAKNWGNHQTISSHNVKSLEKN
jgi:hypothetical protein